MPIQHELDKNNIIINDHETWFSPRRLKHKSRTNTKKQALAQQKKKHFDPFSKQCLWQLFTYDSENGEMTKRSIFIGLVQVAGSEVFDKKCRFAGEKNYYTKEIERELFEVTK